MYTEFLLPHITKTFVSVQVSELNTCSDVTE